MNIFKKKKKKKQAKKLGSITLANRKTQSKTTLRFHFTPMRTANIKKNISKCWQGREVKKLKNPYTLLVEM